MPDTTVLLCGYSSCYSMNTVVLVHSARLRNAKQVSKKAFLDDGCRYPPRDPYQPARALAIAWIVDKLLTVFNGDIIIHPAVSQFLCRSHDVIHRLGSEFMVQVIVDPVDTGACHVLQGLLADHAL